MHSKFERLLSKSLTTLEVMTYYLVVNTGPVQTVKRAATLREMLHVKLAVSLSHSILTPGQPVLTLTSYHQTSGRVATTVQIFKSLARLGPNVTGSLPPSKRTTRPSRQSHARDISPFFPTIHFAQKFVCLFS